MMTLQEWDSLVSETYGKPYSLQQQDGCMDRGLVEMNVPDEDYNDFENDTIPEIVNDPDRGVSFAAWLARDPKMPLSNGEKDRSDIWEINLWWYRNFYPDISMIANDLHSKGLLDAGQYGIKIDW